MSHSLQCYNQTLQIRKAWGSGSDIVFKDLIHPQDAGLYQFQVYRTKESIKQQLEYEDTASSTHRHMDNRDNI